VRKVGVEAKTKLLSRTHLDTCEQVKAALEENYSVRRTLDYYAHRSFRSKQDQAETMSVGREN
jgi:predicted translin family RNA/ssDNA-binding protein